MRSLSKSLMPSAVDKKSLTMPDNPLMMVSGDGRQTLAFSPLLYRISPLCLRDDKASLTDGLPTPKNAISSRSEGRYSPSLISSGGSFFQALRQRFLKVFVTMGFLVVVSPVTRFFCCRTYIDLYGLEQMSF